MTSSRRWNGLCRLDCSRRCRASSGRPFSSHGPDVDRASRPATAGPGRSRLALDRVACASAPRPTGDRDRGAPVCLAPILALEESGRVARPGADRSRDALPYGPAGSGQPHAGRAPHRGRIDRAGAARECRHGVSISRDHTSAGAHLAYLPAAPYAGDLGGGLLHRADTHLQDHLRLLPDQSRPPAHHALERDRAPHGTPGSGGRSSRPRRGIGIRAFSSATGIRTTVATSCREGRRWGSQRS